MQIIFRRKTVPDELNERPDDNIDVWVAENGNTTDETMADLVESAIVPHIVKYGGGPDGEQRALFILDGAGSHKVEGGLFFAACARNNIDIAIIPASCTDEIQLMHVIVNAKFKNSLYYMWVMWMMNSSTVERSNRNWGIWKLGNMLLRTSRRFFLGVRMIGIA